MSTSKLSWCYRQYIPQKPTSFGLSGLFSNYLITFYPEAITPLTLLFSNKLYKDGVSDPVQFEAKYSLIQKNYIPPPILFKISYNICL